MATHRSDTPLLGLPRQPLTPQQQLDALRRMQNQAEQRVKLGMQLFKAVESRVAEQRDLLNAVKQHEQQVQDRVHEDVARTLQQYDQWIGRIDEGFTKALRSLEERFEQLEQSVAQSQGRIEAMMRQAEALLGQARGKLDGPTPPAAAPEHPAPKQSTPPSPAHDDASFDQDKIYSQLLRRLRQSPPNRRTDLGDAENEAA